MTTSTASPAPVEPLRIAIAGLGTVGVGVIRLLGTNHDLIAARAGRPIEVVAVSARDRTKDRGVDLSGYAWEDDMTQLARREDVDVVVELVGGSDGPALALSRAALGEDKGVVTANKAMIAHHGLALAELAEAKGTPLNFVDLAGCFGNTTMATLNGMDYEAIRDNWKDAASARTVAQPRRLNAHVTGIDISHSALAYGQSAGIYDEVIQADLNQPDADTRARIEASLRAANIMFSTAALAIMSALAIGLLEAFAWGVQKTTMYTITNKRVVMRVGVALSATFNLPFSRIVSADMREDKNGAGDIALTLAPGDKLSWLVFWPHVRGFRKGALMPQMICLKDVAIAGNVLSAALAGSRTSSAVTIRTDAEPGRKDAVAARAGRRLVEAAE